VATHNVGRAGRDHAPDELARAAGLPAERLPSALSELAMACWTAHQLDEHDDDDDGDADGGDDD